MNLSPVGMTNLNAGQLSTSALRYNAAGNFGQDKTVIKEAVNEVLNEQASNSIGSKIMYYPNLLVNKVTGFFGGINTEDPGLVNNVAEGFQGGFGVLGAIGVAYGAAVLGRAAYDKVTGYFSSNKAAS